MRNQGVRRTWWALLTLRYSRRHAWAASWVTHVRDAWRKPYHVISVDLFQAIPILIKLLIHCCQFEFWKMRHSFLFPKDVHLVSRIHCRCSQAGPLHTQGERRVQSRQHLRSVGRLNHRQPSSTPPYFAPDGCSHLHRWSHGKLIPNNDPPYS